jgi:hypothetical protein
MGSDWSIDLMHLLHRKSLGTITGSAGVRAKEYKFVNTYLEGTAGFPDDACTAPALQGKNSSPAPNTPGQRNGPRNTRTYCLV